MLIFGAEIVSVFLTQGWQADCFARSTVRPGSASSHALGFVPNSGQINKEVSIRRFTVANCWGFYKLTEDEAELP